MLTTFWRPYICRLTLNVEHIASDEAWGAGKRVRCRRDWPVMSSAPSPGAGFDQCRGEGAPQPEAESDFPRRRIRAGLVLLILERNSLSVCNKSLQFVAEKNKEARKRHDGSGKECAIAGKSGMRRVTDGLARGQGRAGGWGPGVTGLGVPAWSGCEAASGAVEVNKVLSSFCRKLIKL